MHKMTKSLVINPFEICMNNDMQDVLGQGTFPTLPRVNVNKCVVAGERVGAD